MKRRRIGQNNVVPAQPGSCPLLTLPPRRPPQNELGGKFVSRARTDMVEMCAERNGAFRCLADPGYCVASGPVMWTGSELRIANCTLDDAFALRVGRPLMYETGMPVVLRHVRGTTAPLECRRFNPNITFFQVRPRHTSPSLSPGIPRATHARTPLSSRPPARR